VEKAQRRFVLAVELGVILILTLAISLNALRRMDYLGDNAQHIRMTDESRTAYIAKNLADGNGYTTNDLPAALVDFYDQQGKLHDEHWDNADRFPFAAYATAALYKLTGSTSWKVGILFYNLATFVVFLVLLFYAGRSIFDDRYAGLAAVAIALLHPYTYQFLYWKDGDMLVMATASIIALHRYFQRGTVTLTPWFAIGFGTLLGFLFLSRPNLGAALLLGLGLVALSHVWRERGTLGLGGAFKRHLRHEGLVIGVAIVWVIPFALLTLSVWGKPLFSANNLYQLPLGTRFGMGTDTWWKYSEPGHVVTLGKLLHEAPGQVWSKFTSSWLATAKTFIVAYPVELALAFGLFSWLRRKPDAPEPTRPLRAVTWMIVFALVTNLAVLPLYGYQDYSYRHYLGFVLPIIWLAAGYAAVLVLRALRPAARRVIDHVRANAALYGLLAALSLLGWNVASRVPDANRLFGRTSNLIASHWISPMVVIGVVLLRRYLFRPPWYPRIVLAAFSLIYACYIPSTAMKQVNFAWFPARDKVWDSLRAHHGLVSSFALQGEVAWHTGRKNIPAPEWPMHIYSFWLDHKLEVEDLYIESGDVLVSGAFMGAAPGFEGYARLQQYRTLPGYSLAFHEATTAAYPKFRIKPRAKASTVFHLSDRAAFEAITHSPDRIELGDPANVIYTAHGWGGYYTIDGKRAVMGTDATRYRYGADNDDAPYEDASVTFFLDQRHPTSVDLDVWASGPGTFTFFWNLDLYAYDRPSDRAHHNVGTLTATAAGWQRVHLDLPAALPRTGLNKLGFRAGIMQPVVLCPQAMSDDSCLGQFKPSGPPEERLPARVVRPEAQSSVDIQALTLFASTLELHYLRS